MDTGGNQDPSVPCMAGGAGLCPRVTTVTVGQAGTVMLNVASQGSRTHMSVLASSKGSENYCNVPL